ncbi:GNAT family N-acetyltransferase [Kiloniella sp. EL199]|uniref:GNAT family N-acetyltransferase n=1 Tax=Kiloniella sp. EL199 TaxID=2107581 RepID=UPI000EA1BEA3|nr:GNAT family N-acetyltransferase [Kiloniella sp. EL199]
MAELPTYKTKRLIVRPRLIGDVEDCLSMDRDPLVTRYISGPWRKPSKHREFVLSRMTTDYPDGLGYWSVVNQTKPDEFLGWILLLPYANVNREVEIGWRFNRKSWGCGYATEAATAIINHGLQILGLDRIVADIDPQNTPSIKVAEKIGMRFVEDRFFDEEIAKSYQVTKPRTSMTT